MMILLLISAALVVSCCGLGPNLHEDANIYPYILQSLGELEARKMAEKAQQSLPNVIQRASSVCYDELGCFDKNGTFRHLKQLPDPPESVNTQFLLYTRKNWIEPQIIDYKKPESVLNSNIKPSVPLKIITHGFGGKNNMTWILGMKDAFLKKEDLNVIIIDWSLGARVPYYIAAAVNSELVGAQAAVLYYFIKDNLGILEKDLHLVGFSLGAHVVGFIGKRMMELRGTRPSRITGLDPASPLFEDYGNNVHLYKDDADFVDIVHTNADLLIYGGVGIGIPIGHVDYYPNGGKRQPGCISTISGALGDIFSGEKDRVCNHERAVHLYTDTILESSHPCEYIGYSCKDFSEFQQGRCMSCDESDCGTMGYKVKGTGIYYLLTKAKTPFCAELGKLTVRFPHDIKKSFGAIIVTLVSTSGDRENVTISQKDEKLSPGTEKIVTLTVPNDLGSIQVLYKRYNGWITKGAETFGLASVTLEDSKGKFIYKSCEGNIVLKDREYLTLIQSDKTC